MIRKLLFLIVITFSCSSLYANNSSNTVLKASGFIENKGQVTDQHSNSRNDIDFKLKVNNGLNVFIRAGYIHYQFNKTKESNNRVTGKRLFLQEQAATAPPVEMYRLDMQLVGANTKAEIATEGLNDYYETYYTTGAGIDGWRALTYSRVTYKNIYPGIDWVLYTNNGKLKHEFIVNPGGKVSDIRLKYGGATELRINNDASFTAITPMGIISEAAPISYTGQHKDVASGYTLDGDVLSYTVADYTGQLIIDPNIIWSTYYGGSGHDYPSDIIGDQQGYSYTCGTTRSNSNIATTGAHQTTFSGGNSDGFILKKDPSGNTVWATYYGGVLNDYAQNMALDGTGNLYVVGTTESNNSIATTGNYNGGNSDGYLIKLNTSGTRVWGIYMGGSDYDYASAVWADANTVVVAGSTQSLNNISTSGAYQVNHSGGEDGFLMIFDNLGTKQVGTYFGGTQKDWPEDVDVDNSGNIILIGSTGSTTGIASSGSYQTVYGGGPTDCFIVSFSNTGTLNWSTYYGGSGDDIWFDILVGSSGTFYLSGRTSSTAGIAMGSTPHQSTMNGDYDAFLVKFNSSGQPQWATYYGGSGFDLAQGATFHGNEILISGITNSSSNISTPGALQTTLLGSLDGFIASFSSSGTRSWCTYFGGNGYDTIADLFTDQSGNCYMAGETNSSTGISTSGAQQVAFSGVYDCYIAQFCISPTIQTQPTDVTLIAGNQASISVAANGVGLSYQWQANGGSGFVNINDGGQYAGTQTNTLTVSNTNAANNNYKFRCIVSSGSCDETTSEALLTVIPVGINTLSKIDGHIYPNPANSEIIVTSEENISSVVIYSIDGIKKAYHKTSGKVIKVNIDNLIPGMYIIKVNDTHISRITKQ